MALQGEGPPLRITRRQALAAALATPLATALRAQEGGTRVALVIGNAAYAEAPLDNPGRDARAVSQALRELGFAVVELLDADLAGMRQAVSRSRAALDGRRGVGVLFYAGHGLQLDWRNYMVPLGARLASADDVPSRTLGVHEVVDAWRAAGTRTSVLVLDACRDNPFGGIASGRGLAPLDAPSGTFFAYATAPGAVASDGAAGGHGLYTRYLLQELKAPDRPIEALFKRVRLQVRVSSQGRQVPWESTSLEEEFSFRAAAGPAPAASPARPEPPAQRIEAARAEVQEWSRLKDSRSPEELADFLMKHGQGAHAEQAQYRLDQLQADRVRPQVAPGLPEPLRPGARRFEVGDRYEYRRTLDAGRREAAPLRLEVTWVNDHMAVFNNMACDTDQLGNVQRAALRAFPGVEAFPETLCGAAELTPGRRWRQAFGRQDGRAWVELDYRVLGREPVTVGAGRFDTVRIQARGFVDDGSGRTTLERDLWVAPELMVAVRLHLQDRSHGVVFSRYRTEWLELATLARAPRG